MGGEVEAPGADEGDADGGEEGGVFEEFAVFSSGCGVSEVVDDDGEGDGGVDSDGVVEPEGGCVGGVGDHCGGGCVGEGLFSSSYFVRVSILFVVVAGFGWVGVVFFVNGFM